MRLDVESLRRALAQLETSLAYCDSALARQDPGIARQFQAAAIQAFEFTYELARKMLRRHLLNVDPALETEIDMSFQSLIREGYARHLIKSEWRTWSDFRQARGITSHTCNEAAARRVFEQIPAFVEEARHLLAALERSTHDDTA